MATKLAENSTKREEIDRRLARAGQRWTSGRRSVVAVFESVRTPLSADELQAKVGPTVPLSSLYRILSDLVDAKVIIKFINNLAGTFDGDAGTRIPGWCCSATWGIAWGVQGGS